MNFAANISTMFTNLDFYDRIPKAKTLGFKYVEAQDIYSLELELIKNALVRENISLQLLNSPTKPGNPFSEISFRGAYNVCYAKQPNIFDNDVPYDPSLFGEDEPAGFACFPLMQDNFRNSTGQAVILCETMKCKRLHILAGNKPSDHSFADCELFYKHNLSEMCGYLENMAVVGLIEPLSHKPNYFLQSYEKALEYVKEINHDHIKLLLDVFHLFKIEGSIDGLAKYLPYAGHVQISQSPNRDDPFQQGEIDYQDVMNILRENNYTGSVGLEYTPKDIQNPDLSFMAKYA